MLSHDIFMVMTCRHLYIYLLSVGLSSSLRQQSETKWLPYSDQQHLTWTITPEFQVIDPLIGIVNWLPTQGKLKAVSSNRPVLSVVEVRHKLARRTCTARITSPARLGIMWEPAPDFLGPGGTGTRLWSQIIYIGLRLTREYWFKLTIWAHKVEREH